jgi:beta-lactamase class A
MKKIYLICSLFFMTSIANGATLDKEISEIEKSISGRIGISVLNTQNDEIWNYNGDARFPMMSTFKTLACAKLLSDSDNGFINKQTEFRIKKDDLIVWSPIIKKLEGETITLERACEATMLMSDNTAANIVLQHIGGPEGVTGFLRSIDDKVTRLDRNEPELNQAKSGDLRDTTTPNAMVSTLNEILLGNVLTEQSSKSLKSLMSNNKVSNSLLRSILPKGWFIADRSGAGNNGSRGITALVWTESQAPIIIAIYMTETELKFKERNRIIADIGKLIFKKFEISQRVN